MREPSASMMESRCPVRVEYVCPASGAGGTEPGRRRVTTPRIVAAVASSSSATADRRRGLPTRTAAALES